MNDKDKDPNDDGAGPPRQAPLRILALILALSPLTLNAQEAGSLRGLSLTARVGALHPSNQQANFYNGAPTNANTLLRILHSESFGHSIWNHLTEQDLIGSSVQNYNQITVAEYGDMYYRLAIQLGLGFRYDFYNSPWGWMMRFDYARLNAVGQVLLNSGKETYLLTNQNRYVTCPISGQEERIYIDFGLLRKFRMRGGYDLELAAGANLSNTKVQANDIQIADVTYSILDIWNGHSPSSYTASYPYVNQGGLGYGTFATISIGYTLPVGTALMLQYSLHYLHTRLTGYSGYAPHHTLTLAVALNNFKLFDD